MPSSSSRRAPLEDSRAANRSISASFTGTKASLSSQSKSSSRKSASSVPSSSKSRSASAKHRSRFDDDDDIPEQDEDDNDDDDDEDSYDDEDDRRRSSSKSNSKPSQRSSKFSATSQPSSGNVSRQVSASSSNNPNKSILARQNANSSVLMGGSGGGANTSMAFQNSRFAALARSQAASDASVIMRPRGQQQPGIPGASAAAAAAAVNPTAAAAAAASSLRVDTSSFEEWMKMATDNKINSTNTWSFALIDYFHDMSLLRNDSGDGSINFQKASCTLDGCVKVWTSRVDSVVVETGKLLSGLQDDLEQAAGKDKRSKTGGDGHDDDDDDDDGADGDEATSSRKKKRNREATLAKNFSQIQVKKFDLEFTVDPLFKKTSADFDEGGAGGLLMNHLGVDSSMRVVFDASDVAGVGGDDDLNETLAVDENGEVEDGHVASDENLAPRDTVDLTKLRAALFNPDDYEDPDNAPETASQLLAGRVICPTLCNFRFSKDDDTPFGVGMDEFNEQSFHAMDVQQGWGGGGSAGYRAESDEFGGGGGGGFQDDLDPMMDGGADGGDVDFFANAGAGVPPTDDDEEGGEHEGLDFFDAPTTAPGLRHGGPTVIDGTSGNIGGFGPFDPSAGPSSEIVMAMAFNAETGQALDDADGDNAGGLFDYFDRRLMRNWAGPEHWKLSRVAATGPLGVGGINGAAAIGANKADLAAARRESKKSKEPFVIDFLSEDGAVNAKEIFEPAKQAASISLPSAARAKMTSASSTSKDAYLLPEDRHFSSKQLLRLFLKPRVAINMRRRGGGSSQPSSGVDDGYWASAAGDGDGDGDEYGDLNAGGDNGMPFDTQFFHDADDGGDAGDSPANTAGNGDLEDEDLMQTMQALNRVRPEYVNYAKKAKRVDVKKLKENIWKQLAIPQTSDPSDSISTSTSASVRGGTIVEETSDSGEESETGGAKTPPSPASTLAQGKGGGGGGVKTFSSVLGGLKKAYPQDKMEEISTSFCFICLLHLANEEGLALSTGNDAQLDLLRRRQTDRARQSSSFSSSISPVSGDAFGGMLSRGTRVIQSSKDDDDLGGNDDYDDEDDPDMHGYQEDELRVGKLELLQIVKDPNAYRSA